MNWYNQLGKEHDTVISSRIRFARNLCEYPFGDRLSAEKANEIINRQMKVAQEIAGLLGETTAETKSALLEMMYVLKGGEEK